MAGSARAAAQGTRHFRANLARSLVIGSFVVFVLVPLYWVVITSIKPSSDYLTVPPESLLQDDKRIERAMRNATMPLRYTPEQIDAGSKDPAVSTSAISPSDMPKPPEAMHKVDKPLLVPREQILSSVHRVVLGALMPNGFTNSPDVAARYRSLVHDQLIKLGWEVIDADQLQPSMTKAVQQVGGIYNLNTGKAEPAKLKSVMQLTLNSLGLAAPADAVAMISLVPTTANQVVGNVYWDGTFQSAMTLGPASNRAAALGGTAELNAGEGSITALSLSFILRDANGTLLVDSRGGIQLTQRLTLQAKHEGSRTTYLQSYTNLTTAELLADPARDAHAVAAALHELVTEKAQVAVDQQTEK